MRIRTHSLKLVFIAAVLLLIALFAYYHMQKQRLVTEIKHDLYAILNHKREAVIQWRTIRLDKASLDLIKQYNFPLLERWVANPPQAEEMNGLTAALRATQMQYQYNDVLFFHPTGKVYFRLNAQSGEMAEVSRRALDEAFQRNEAILTDLYLDPKTGKPQIDQVIPFFKQDGNLLKYIGAVIFQYDGEKLLDSFLEPPPILGRSVESFLIRPEKGSVLYLSKLQRKRDAALRIQAEKIDSIAVQAMQVRNGLVLGKDYQGINAVAVVDSIPGTDWLIISKIDASEAFASLNQALYLMLGGLLVFILSVTASLVTMRVRKSQNAPRLNLAADSSVNFERSIKTILDDITEGCHLIDFEWRYLYCNNAAAQHFGYTKERLFNHSAMEPLRALENTVFSALKECMKERKPQYIESELEKSDGTKCWLAFGVQPMPEGIFLLSRDITARKNVEAENFQLLSAIEQSSDLVMILDEKRYIRYVNPAFEIVTGYRNEEILGQLPVEVIHESQDEKFHEAFWETILKGKAWQGSYVNSKKDGSLYLEEMSVQPICDHSGKPVSFVMVKRDITKYQKLEEEKDNLQAQLFQSQKIESIGRLAGGIAHDFNNMLNVIHGHAQLMLEDVNPEHHLFDSLQEINKAAIRSAELTNQLLAFARKQAVSPKVIHLNDTISGLLTMLRRLIGEGIHLAWIPGHDLWPVRMDPSQIHQILTNLAVNAKDAIGNTGRISIETGNTSVDLTSYRKSSHCVPGDYVIISIRDNGSGMGKEIQNQIFEPFYTTKDVGKGTGLGLSTVYGIVKQNNGFIAVDSELGHGSMFKIFLPRYGGDDNRLKESIESDWTPEKDMVNARKTILLVEDEIAVKRLTQTILQRLGYTVHSAGNPHEAIKMGESHKGEIDLMIVDVVMPEMNGRELADQLLASHRGLKLLYMSGYTADVIAHHGIIDENINFIQKPFSPKALAMKVREALRETA